MNITFHLSYTLYQENAGRLAASSRALAARPPSSTRLPKRSTRAEPFLAATRSRTSSFELRLSLRVAVSGAAWPYDL